MRVELEGTPETLLWTLYYRASEARRADAVLRDPKAVDLLDAIDFPFEERFGSATAGWAHWQALRARCFDRQVERFLAAHPDGTVVALGEGLETQFWRVDNGRVHWLSVDVPEAVEVRERLLPPPQRQRLLACSALDERWIDEVDLARGVLVTAQGLFMYLPPDDVRRLIARLRRAHRGWRARVRRGAAMAERAQPARRTDDPGRLAGPALDVVDGQGRAATARRDPVDRRTAPAADAARARRPVRLRAAADRRRPRPPLGVLLDCARALPGRR